MMPMRFYRRKRAIRGQAISELVVCLIGVLIVILGYLLISALSLENVDNLIRAREEADVSARSRTSGWAGKNIGVWDYGARNIPFTQDDVAEDETIADSSAFAGELVDNGGTFNLLTASANSYGYLPSDYNASSSLSFINMMLNAANLAGGSANESDPLGKRGLDSLKDAIRNMFGTAQFQITDTVYIPVAPNVRDPESITVSGD